MFLQLAAIVFEGKDRILCLPAFVAQIPGDTTIITGALCGFLDKLALIRNISLPYYRNHGSEYSRVLTGLQLSDTASYLWRSS